MNTHLDMRTGEAELKDDERFKFAWMTPKATVLGPLIVAIHGSERDHVATCEAFRDLAQRVGASVIAPLFPTDVDEIGYGDGYKFLQENDIDYIEVFTRMLKQFRTDMQIEMSRYFLFGFSGGAQFAQRFSLFRAHELLGLVLAAPGGVTLPRQDLDWWPGIKGAEEVLNYKLDLEALRDVPTSIIVGLEDISGSISRTDPTSRNGSVNADFAGLNRVNKARSLTASLIEIGVPAHLVELPGVGHSLTPYANAASEVIHEWLVAEYDLSTGSN